MRMKMKTEMRMNEMMSAKLARMRRAKFQPHLRVMLLLLLLMMMRRRKRRERERKKRMRLQTLQMTNRTMLAARARRQTLLAGTPGPGGPTAGRPRCQTRHTPHVEKYAAANYHWSCA